MWIHKLSAYPRDRRRKCILDISYKPTLNSLSRRIVNLNNNERQEIEPIFCDQSINIDLVPYIGRRA